MYYKYFNKASWPIENNIYATILGGQRGHSGAMSLSTGHLALVGEYQAWNEAVEYRHFRFFKIPVELAELIKIFILFIRIL
jgi:hypothetical protein